MVQVRLVGGRVDEHRAAKGLFAQAIADDCSECLEDGLTRMHPDSLVLLLRSNNGQTVALRGRIHFQGVQKRINRAPRSRPHGETSVQVAVDLDVNEWCGTLDELSYVAR